MAAKAKAKTTPIELLPATVHAREKAEGRERGEEGRAKSNTHEESEEERNSFQTQSTRAQSSVMLMVTIAAKVFERPSVVLMCAASMPRRRGC